MSTITREMLAGYLDDALSEAETARIEQALRQTETLRKQLRGLLQERDRGEHSVGAVWRRQRLSCPGREQLGSWLLGVLDPDEHDYVKFHLRTIGCAYCLANLADLEEQQRETPPATQQRRRRMYESSAGFIGKKP
jgi:hypothetical protein